jgi:hypothetical protein
VAGDESWRIAATEPGQTWVLPEENVLRETNEAGRAHARLTS